MRSLIPIFQSITLLLFVVSPVGAQWIQTNGPAGGNVNVLTADGSNLFAGTAGGVFLSTDDGDSWTDISSGLTNPDIRAIAVLGGNIFAGSFGGGIFLSTDNGTSWTAAHGGLTNLYVRSILVAGTDIYAGTGSTIHGGIFRSSDSGASWTNVSAGLPTNTAIYSLALHGGSLFAGSVSTTVDQVYRSTDNGSNWTPVINGMPSRKVFAFSAIGANFFAGSSGGVYLTTDDGDSWTSVSTGLPTSSTSYALVADGTNLFAGVAQPSSTGKGVYFSTNGGTNWTTVNLGLTDLDARTLVVHNSFLFAGTLDSGVSRRPLNEFFLHTIVADAGAHGTIKTAGINYVEDGGSLRFKMNPGGGYYVDSVIVDGIKTDSTTTYTFINVLGDHTIHAMFAMCLTTFERPLSPAWNLVSLPATLPDASIAVLFPAAISYAYLYTDAYYQESALEFGFGYWLKFDGAQSAEITGCPLTEYTFDVIPGWNLIGSIGSPVPVATITTDPPGIITSNFFGYHGSYYSVDTIQPGVAYWVKVDTEATLTLSSTGSTAAPANRIRINPSAELPPPAPDREDQTLATPTAFRLGQNYPNPFNPTTTIQYDLPAISHVRLTVYDVLGREVALLVDGVEQPGFKSVAFDAGKLASGLYYYRLQADNFVETKKFLLIR